MKIIYLITELDPVNLDKYLELRKSNSVMLFQTKSKDEDYEWNNSQSKKTSLLEVFRFLFESSDKSMLICCGYMPKSNFRNILLLRPFVDKCVLQTDSTLISTQNRYMFLKKQLFRLFDHFITAGTLGIKYLENVGVKSEKISTPVNVYKKPNTTMVLSNKEYDCIVIARDIYEKNLDFLIEYLLSQKYSTHFYGSSRDINSDFLNFHGFRSRVTVFSALQRSKFLLLPSVSETWGHVVFEAIINNTIPLVSKKVGCYLDLIEKAEKEFKVELSFDPYCKESVDKVLKAAMEFKTLQYSQILKFLNFQIRKNFSLDKYVETIISIS